MKNTVKRTTARIIIVVMIAVTVFFAKGTALNAVAFENNTKAIGTVEAVREFIEEALKEKAIVANTKNIETTVEPVVEGATGTTAIEIEEEAEAEIEEVVEEEIEIEETVEVVEETTVVEEATVEEATVEETTVEEIVIEEETTIAEEAEVEIIEDDEEVVEEEIEEVVEEVEEETAISEEIVVGEDVENSTVASTANAPATTDEVVTVDGVSEEGYEDAVTVAYTEETTYTVANTTAAYLGTTDGTRSAFTVIGDDTLYYHSQEVIDAGNIICYPNCDMTTGVKYFAGHNPGAMSHMNATRIGSVVRLSNDDTYQDYRIIDHATAAHGESFGSIYLNGQNVWTMLTRGTQNAVIVQFCINGENNFWYGEAI